MRHEKIRLSDHVPLAPPLPVVQAASRTVETEIVPEERAKAPPGVMQHFFYCGR